MVTGKRSIEELLNIPEELKPGRYTLNCGVLIGTSGWVLFARCYPRVGSAPKDLQKAVMYAAKTSLFEPATRNGKRSRFTTADGSSNDDEPLILAVPNDGPMPATTAAHRVAATPRRQSDESIDELGRQAHTLTDRAQWWWTPSMNLQS